MSGFLLDTNVLSELRRPRPEPRVLDFMAGKPLDQLYISVVTLAEIRYGVESMDDADRRALLGDWLTHRIRSTFAARTLPIDEDVMVRWRMLVEAGRRRRHTYQQPDLLIAATALNHDLIVVTRNVADFAAAGVAVIDPWRQAEAP